MRWFHKHDDKDGMHATWVPVTVDGEQWQVGLTVSGCSCGEVSASIHSQPSRVVDMDKIMRDAMDAKPRISIGLGEGE